MALAAGLTDSSLVSRSLPDLVNFSQDLMKSSPFVRQVVKCGSSRRSTDECLASIVFESSQPVDCRQQPGLVVLGWNDGSFTVTTEATIPLNIRTKDNRPHHHRLESWEIEAFLRRWQ
jgi:hypothetical protein